MTDRGFQRALRECLRALGNGESIDDCIARYPLQAAALREMLELRRELHALASHAASTSAYMVGTAPMLAGLSDHRRGRSLPFSLSTFAGKVAAMVAAGALLVAGTAGASAALGGPNLPAAFITRIGDVFPGGGASGPQVDGDEELPGIQGLCEGYSEKKLGAAAFKRLEEAAATTEGGVAV